MSQNRAKTEPRTNQSRRRSTFLRKRLKPRVRDLFLDLMKDQKDAGAYLESQCLKVAELTARAEDLRAKLAVMVAEKGSTMIIDADQVKSLAVLINSVTRLESTARRAAADLGKVAEVVDTSSEDLMKAQEEGLAELQAKAQAQAQAQARAQAEGEGND
jgi:hypothetical protein